MRVRFKEKDTRNREQERKDSDERGGRTESSQLLTTEETVQDEEGLRGLNKARADWIMFLPCSELTM